MISSRPPSTPSQAKTDPKVQEPSSSVADGLKLPAAESVHPGISSALQIPSPSVSMISSPSFVGLHAEQSATGTIQDPFHQ